MAKLTRTSLYDIFKTGNKPNQEDFKNVIDSQLNSIDDGIVTTEPGRPIQLNAQGAEHSVLAMASSEGDVQWQITQRSADDVAGLAFTPWPSPDTTPLFIKTENNFVGINQNNPAAQLHISAAAGSTEGLSVEGNASISMGLTSNHITTASLTLGSSSDTIRALSNSKQLGDSATTLVSEKAINGFVSDQVTPLKRTVSDMQELIALLTARVAALEIA